MKSSKKLINCNSNRKYHYKNYKIINKLFDGNDEDIDWSISIDVKTHIFNIAFVDSNSNDKNKPEIKFFLLYLNLKWVMVIIVVKIYDSF